MLELIKWIVPSLITLAAAYLGINFGLKQIRIQKQLDFYERQLKEFYSPLLGYRSEILAKSNVRVKISTAANEAWQELCKSQRSPDWDHEKAYAPYDKIINYDNEQFRNELFPLYEKMMTIFRENYWLSEPDTRKWYPELCEFVEVWRRWLSSSIPFDVVEKLDHSEDKIKPFYDELEKQVDILRGRLK